MSRLTSLSLSTLLALGAFTSGCTPQEAPGGDLDPRVLYSFEGCDDLLGYTKDRAKDLIDQYGNLYGYDYSGGWWWGEGDEGLGDTGGTSGGDGGEAPSDGGGGTPGEDYSGTNVQEAGVDEADIVKTDGERILALGGGKLHFVDASGVAPKLRGSLDLGVDAYSAQLFLHGSRAMVLVRTWPFQYDENGQVIGSSLSEYFGEDFWGGVLRLIEVDLSDPDNLKVLRNLYVTGDLVSARMIDGVSRVVLRSSYSGLAIKEPGEFFNWAAYEFEVGVNGYNEAIYQKYWDIALAQSKTHNKAVIDASKPENWLPRFVLSDVSSGQEKISQGLLLDCEQVMHAGVYAGLSTVSVMTVDLGAGMALGESVGLFSEGETVYASKENLYVAMSPWTPADWGLAPEEEQQQGKTTYVHKFDIQARDRAKYVASGSVRGRLLSQWALSERAGDLRVASTDMIGWDQASSESFVSVLRQEGDELVQIGQVGGLGKTEQIQGVRFIDDVGYVVTFRQTDPLYTVDVSDPTAPVVAGELKIPGFSAYLHPVGEGLILGVGRDGTEEGQLLGLQLSLFDVSDAAAPKQIHKETIGSEWGWSEALFDHKAFLWWGKTGLTMLPLEWSSYDENQGYTWEQGAFGFTVDKEAGISLLGDVQHPQQQGGCVDEFDCYYWSSALRRSMVIGDLVYTLSDVGLKASYLSDLTEAHWLAFPE